VVLAVDADNWVQEMAPDLPPRDVAQLGPDREIIFEALVEFLQAERPEDLELEVPEDEKGVAADAPLLLPGARIHIRVRPELGPTIKDAVKIAVGYALGADPATAGAALSIDLVYRIFTRVTKLEKEEVEIVMMLLDLRRGEGSPPSTAQLGAALPELGDPAGRLEALAEKRVIAEESGGWVVSF
jgi:hypothetical protein